MGQIKRSIPASSDQSVATQGNVVYIVQASAGFTLEIGSERFDVQQGDKLQVAGGYTSLRLINPSATAVDVEIVATNGDFHRSQIASAVTIQSSVPLPVNIAEQTLANWPDLRSARTFMASYGFITSALAAGDHVIIGLVNPTGSAKELIDPVMHASLDNPSAGHWFSYVNSIPNTIAELSAGLANFNTFSPVNKNLTVGSNAAITAFNGSVSTGYGTSATPNLTISNPLGSTGGSKTNQPIASKFEQGGVILGPGQGIIYDFKNIVNQGALDWTLEWIEQ